MTLVRASWPRPAASLAAALALLLHAGAALAAPGTSAPVAAVPPSPAGGGFQVLFGLVVVLALMAGAVWLLKRFGPAHIAANANVKVVGGVSVGNRERVVVVEIADQWIVVGVAPGRVNALANMARQEAPASTIVSGMPNPEPARSFSSWLKQTVDKRNGIR